MAFQIGELIGDYEIRGVLGAGGMGTVYRVRNLISDRFEALKALLPDLTETADLGERFSREIKIQASLDHPNIAALRTAFRSGNQLLMIMELVEGQNVEQRLRQGPIEVQQSLGFIGQVLSALAYAHAQGVIHRDIKPANIMITPAGTIKLMDFGIASAATNRRLTQTGMAVGSLHYMSPEQVQALAPDARSDLYSVGVTLYEMLSGQRPFTGANDYETIRAIVEREPPPLNAVNPTLSAIVMKALAKLPDYRYQSAGAFGEALLSVSTAPTQAAPVRTESGTWDTGALDRVKKDLAVYIGPLARILVDRAAKKAKDMPQLYEILAAEISSWSDREKFLASRPR